MSRIGGSWSVCSSWSRYTFWCSCHCGLQVSRFSRTGTVTQKSLSRRGRNSGGRSFVVFNFGTVDFAVSKEATSHQALLQALLRELEDLAFCPDPQCKLTTLHPKWTMSCASWLLSAHLDLLMTFFLLVHQPADLVPGFLSTVIPTTLLLKKTPFQWTTVTQEAFSHHDVTFTSTPVLLCSDSAQPLQSRVFKPNNWSYFITTEAKFIP